MPLMMPVRRWLRTLPATGCLSRARLERCAIRIALRRWKTRNTMAAGWEALPTGLAHNDGSFYVTLFSGCPHTSNSGELVAVDSSGQQRTVAGGLNMPIDVAVDAAGSIWIWNSHRRRRAAIASSLDQHEASGRLSRINGQGRAGNHRGGFALSNCGAAIARWQFVPYRSLRRATAAY